MTRRLRVAALFMGVLSMTGVERAFAQTPAQPAPAAAGGVNDQMGFGIRGGISNPKQGVVGGEVETPRLGITQHASLRPDVEIGFGGGNGTIVTVDMMALAWLPFPNSSWSAYVGGGPVLVHDVQFGGSGAIVVGLQNRQGLFFEMKASGGGVIKGMVGIMFHKH